MNIEERLIKIVQQNVDVKNITRESSLSSLGLDSIDVANVLFEIENEFNIRFEDEEMMSLKTVNDVIVSIEKKLK